MVKYGCVQVSLIVENAEPVITQYRTNVDLINLVSNICASALRLIKLEMVLLFARRQVRLLTKLHSFIIYRCIILLIGNMLFVRSLILNRISTKKNP